MIFVFNEKFANVINTFLTIEERGKLMSALMYAAKEDEYPFNNHPEISDEKAEMLYSLLLDDHGRLYDDLTNGY